MDLRPAVAQIRGVRKVAFVAKEFFPALNYFLEAVLISKDFQSVAFLLMALLTVRVDFFVNHFLWVDSALKYILFAIHLLVALKPSSISSWFCSHHLRPSER